MCHQEVGKGVDLHKLELILKTIGIQDRTYPVGYINVVCHAEDCLKERFFGVYLLNGC